AVVALAAGGALGVARSARDHPSPAAPSGVIPHHIVRPDLGFSIDVPQSWLDTSALYGTAFGFGSTLDAGKQRGYANAALVSGATLQAAADDWTTRVKQALGGSITSRVQTTVDGRPAIRVRFTGRNTRLGNPFPVTETSFVFHNRAGASIVVSVG